MKTTVTERGQTALPARIRRKFGIRPGQKLEWIENGMFVSFLPVVKDPVRGFRGSSRREGLLKKLLEERRRDVRFV